MTTTAESLDLVWRTKLRPPPLPPGFISRPRLNARLEAGLRGKLTLVRAPVGYGKSIALGDWVRRLDRRWAWLSLDRYDDQLEVFTRALVEAIREAVPEAGTSLLSLLLQASTPASAYLARTLGNELLSVVGELVLVLDDYQVLEDARIHELVAALIEHLPSNAHLVIASREEPPLPLGLLRGRGQLSEVGAAELCLNTDEVRALLGGEYGAASEGLAAELEERTEGWVAGLRLITSTFFDRPAPTVSRLLARSAGQESVRELLVEQALAAIPASEQRFLLATSILDRFQAELCEAVVGPGGLAEPARLLLRRLERSNCFLVPLDDERTWYRYHHLFQQALQRELAARESAEAIASLHARASVWLAEQGLVPDAVSHALATGDRAQAAELVEAGVPGCLNREDWATLDSWLQSLPAELVAGRPMLQVARAAVLHFRGRYGAIPPVLEQAETLLARESAPLEPADLAATRGTIDTLRSLLSLLGDAAGPSLACARQALARMPAGWAYVRGGAAFLASMAMQRLGEGDQARRWLLDELTSERQPEPVYRARLLLGLAYSELASAQLARCEQLAHQILALADQHDLPSSSVWAHYFLGLAAYEWDDLSAAREHFSAAVALRDRANANAVRDSRLGLALTMQALASPEIADALLRGALEPAEQTQNQADLLIIRSFQARLALSRGRLAEASRLLALYEGPGSGLTAALFEMPALTRVQRLLALGTEASLNEALDQLSRFGDLCQARHDANWLIPTRALRALVHRRLGQQAVACELLAEALALAEPGRLIRTFVDLGRPMAALLGELVERGGASPYAEQLLARLRAASDPCRLSAHQQPASPPGLVEPLTRREIEVLQLLEARLSNKEIADVLVLATETVKKHAANIYQKLGVGSRREAVTRARELDLLSDVSTSRG